MCVRTSGRLSSKRKPLQLLKKKALKCARPLKMASMLMEKTKARTIASILRRLFVPSGPGDTKALWSPGVH